MSSHAMQQVLCRAVVDRGFIVELLETPHAALAEYDLTPDEQAVFLNCDARSLTDLAAAVEGWRRGEMLPVRSTTQPHADQRELALAS